MNLNAFLRSLYRRLLTVAAVLLVLLAVYVSIGRQFMPAVSGYRAFAEQRIAALSGLPVTIESLDGGFTGLSPVLIINGLQLPLQAGEPADALRFDRVTVAIDIPRSLWRRDWVIRDFTIEPLHLDLQQTAAGKWHLAGMDLGGGTDEDTPGLDSLQQNFQQVLRLGLRDVALNIQPYGGESLQLQGDGDFWLELQDGELASVTAIARLPAVTFSGNARESVTLSDIAGRLHLSRLPSPPSFPRLLLSEPGESSKSTRGETSARGETRDGWRLILRRTSLTWQGREWRDFDLMADYHPQQSLSLRASHIDMGILSGLALGSGLLPDPTAATLGQYAPAGILSNLSAFLPLSDSAAETTATLRTNLSGIALSSVRGSPSVAGVDGYLQLEHHPATQRLTGRAEIQSDDFAINIPNTFTRTWQYRFVNGALDFSADLSGGGRQVRIASTPIIAQSDVIDGRVQFTSVVHQRPGRERHAHLDLLVGASRVDTAARALYLPDGATIKDDLRSAMAWLEGALIGGEVFDAGVIFRGSTLLGAPPISKTFQSFYNLRDGVLQFSPDWPPLQGMTATVLTADDEIDIQVAAAHSVGVQAREVLGLIRPDADGISGLRVQGRISGELERGLDYLRTAPLGDGLHREMADWRGGGGFDGDLEVIVPLDNLTGGNEEEGSSQADGSSLGAEGSTRPTEVNLEVALSDNSLEIPAYALSLETVAGAIRYSTRAGLSSTPLQAQAFGSPATITLSSAVDDLQLQTITVEAAATTTVAQIIDWPLQIDFVRSLLQEAGPDIPLPMTMHLEIDQSGRDTTPTVLQLWGDLAPVVPDFPPPYALAAADPLPMHLRLGFAADGFQAAHLHLAEARLPPLDLSITPDTEAQAWDLGFEGETIQGQAEIPYDPAMHLTMELDHLRLPEEQAPAADKVPGASQAPAADDNQERTEAIPETPAPRRDLLADIDPRLLPPMHFSTQEFMVGEQPFGSWAFTLDPTATGADVSDLRFNFRGLMTGPDAPESTPQPADFRWHYDGREHRSTLKGILYTDDLANVLQANGYAATLNSGNARFDADLHWPGSPAFFSGANLSGSLSMDITDGRFQQGAGGTGALKLVSILNFDAIVRRLRLSDDLLRSGLAYDEIKGEMRMDNGLLHIKDRLVISGPSSLYQITGHIDLAEETIDGELYVTLPVSDNIPWLTALLTTDLSLAVGAYLLQQIFGSQVDSLTSAVYTLEGPWEGLEPKFKQAFGSPPEPDEEHQPRQD